VVGRGGRKEGTGVQGLGGGAPEEDDHGAVGIGVHGIGGSQLVYSLNPKVAPGAGLVGQGGRQSQLDNTLQLPHAAGVIGIDGGSGPDFDALPSLTLMETGGVGVYGQGADLTTSRHRRARALSDLLSKAVGAECSCLISQLSFGYSPTRLR
jgi:hypothetical protein